MNNKNRFLLSLLIFIIVTIVWYFVLDAKSQTSADFCAMVDCLPQGELSWPLFYGSSCCGSLTTFRVFVYQFLQLLTPGIVLAGIAFATLKKNSPHT